MEIRQVAKDIKTINKYIKAYETLFDKKPIVLLKGTFTSEYDDFKADYYEPLKITSRSVYFDTYEGIPFYTYDDEYYHVILKDKK